jgi:acyl-CoA thioesterase FadM
MDYLNKYALLPPIREDAPAEADFFKLAFQDKALYHSPANPRPEIQLLSLNFDTGLLHGNSVGNLYYSNYYDWQARTIEKYLSGVIPEIFTDPSAGLGEYTCLETRVSHIQEAMPFEDVQVSMYLESIYSGGLRLFFEYFAGTDHQKRKLAYGYNTLAWVKRKDPKVKPVPCQLPEKLLLQLRNPAYSKVTGAEGMNDDDKLMRGAG